MTLAHVILKDAARRQVKREWHTCPFCGSQREPCCKMGDAYRQGLRDARLQEIEERRGR